MTDSGMVPGSGWLQWTEKELAMHLRASKIDDKLINQLIDYGWNSGGILSELTEKNLKDAGFKSGHLAAMKTLYRKYRIPNPDLNPQDQSAPSSSAPVRSASQIPRLAQTVLPRAQAVPTPKGFPPVFKLAMTKCGEDLNAKIRSFVIGSSPLAQAKPEKRVLVLGSTGSGKTTWINGITNFLYSVEWMDNFRFKIVTENDETGSAQANNQAFSQTDFVTSYKFIWQPGFPCEFNMVLIDTPGFGDTRGIKRDEQIVAQLKSLFETRGVLGLDQLDAIAFVVAASNARLTATQKYIFNAILSIFGRDAIQNLLLIATFADGGEPQVMHAVHEEKITYREVLKFNNSALFARNSTVGQSIDSFYWSIGTSSYQIFFKLLRTLQPQSLILTREVLRERQSLHVKIQRIHQLVGQGIAELDQIEQEEAFLRQHQLVIHANSNYTTKVRVQKAEQIRSPPGLFVTNCIICNMTCHHDCAYKDNCDKIHCCAMDSNGHCHVCPRKCIWHEHQNQPFYWDFKIVEETKTLEELRVKYQEAKGKETSSQDILVNLRQKYNRIKQELRENVEAARQHVNRLGQIAARPNPLSSVDYIDLLIESERMEKKSGWDIRVKHLQEVRRYAETGTAIQGSGEYMPAQWQSRRKN
jgi:hypothetical protein